MQHVLGVCRGKRVNSGWGAAELLRMDTITPLPINQPSSTLFNFLFHNRYFSCSSLKWLGISSSTVVPFPGLLVIRISPRCSCMIWRT